MIFKYNWWVMYKTLFSFMHAWVETFSLIIKILCYENVFALVVPFRCMCYHVNMLMMKYFVWHPGKHLACLFTLAACERQPSWMCICCLMWTKMYDKEQGHRAATNRKVTFPYYKFWKPLHEFMLHSFSEFCFHIQLYIYKSCDQQWVLYFLHHSSLFFRHISV